MYLTVLANDDHRTLSLPCLTHLSLVRVRDYENAWRSILTPTTLPSLHTLNIRQDEPDITGDWGLQTIKAVDFVPIAPQLRVISLRDPRTSLISSFPWSLCLHLERLTLGCGTFDFSSPRQVAVVAPLLQLPRPLQHLRIVMGFISEIPTSVVAELDDLSKIIGKREDALVQQLTLPRELDVYLQHGVEFGVSSAARAVYDAVQRLGDCAEERGIDVTRSGTIDVNNKDEWLRYLDEW